LKNKGDEKLERAIKADKKVQKATAEMTEAMSQLLQA
jgi:hypothetical protein